MRAFCYPIKLKPMNTNLIVFISNSSNLTCGSINFHHHLFCVVLFNINLIGCTTVRFKTILGFHHLAGMSCQSCRYRCFFTYFDLRLKSWIIRFDFFLNLRNPACFYCAFYFPYFTRACLNIEFIARYFTLHFVLYFNDIAFAPSQRSLHTFA